MNVLALMVGCLVHDIDHRGHNNAFVTHADDGHLSGAYGNEATLEKHHCAVFNSLIEVDELNLFDKMELNDQDRTIAIIEVSEARRIYCGACGCG